MGEPRQSIMEIKDRLIVALDVPDAESALEWVARLGMQVRWFKIGLQLFTSAGPDLVRRIARGGHSIFLDLKFHDIPNTVAQAVRSVAPCGAAMINVHGCGGGEMMASAAKAATEGEKSPVVLAVTVLTSMSAEDLQGVGVQDSPADQVVRLGKLAQQSGLGGLVCSGREIAPLREALGWDMKLVVPGIRPAGAEVGDQKRTMTPEEAIADGADYLVIGRPILQAIDPYGEVERILGQMADGWEKRQNHE